MVHDIEVVHFSLDLSAQKQKLLYQFLSDDEKQRASAYRFDKHRQRFICGRGSIREILADRVGCQAGSIDFKLNEFGKPSLLKSTAAHTSDYWLHFNASSSATSGVIALSSEFAVGIDIELIKGGDENDLELIAKNEFTRDEYNWYSRRHVSAREKAFYQLWTCKEAYLKALGVGLSAGLDSFSIEVDNENLKVKYTDLENGGVSSWYLYTLDAGKNFAGCLAIEKDECDMMISHW